MSGNNMLPLTGINVNTNVAAKVGSVATRSRQYGNGSAVGSRVEPAVGSALAADS